MIRACVFRLSAVLLGGASSLLFLECSTLVWLEHVASPESAALYARVEDQVLRYEGHPYLGYALNAAWARGPNRHNSLGYRGEEISREKPDNTFRIATLGGSTTYTTSVADDRLTYPAQLERELNERSPFPRFEVINAGVADYTTWESLANLQFRVLDLDPDLVIVYHAANDVGARTVPSHAYRSDGTGHRRVWGYEEARWEASAFLRVLGRRRGWSELAVVDAFTHAPTLWDGSGPVEERLRANTPLFFERNLVSMIGVAREHGVAVMLATFAWHPAFPGPPGQSDVEHNAVIQRVGREHDVPVFDFASAMPRDRALFTDAIHLNVAGALVKAQLFARFLSDHELVPGTGDGSGIAERP